MSNKALLSVNVVKSFADFSLSVDFNLPKGITALVGPSGSGKTTLANLIAGIDIPDGGAIKTATQTFFDEEKRKNLSLDQRKIGYVFQDGILFPHMTVRQNLMYGMPKGASLKGFNELVIQFELENLLNRHPANLSGGEKRRVAIGRALLSEPNILILDEPLTGLDPARRKVFFPFLDRLKTIFNGPILYISHYMDEVAHLADYGLLLSYGFIKAEGPIESLFLDPEFISYLGSGDSAALFNGIIGQTEKGVTEINCNGLTLKSTSSLIKRNSKVRLCIYARDVSLSLFKPEGVSVLNCIPCVINNIDLSQPNDVDLQLRPTKAQNGEIFLSKISKLSYEQLNIKKGQQIFAMIKAIAITNS